MGWLRKTALAATLATALATPSLAAEPTCPQFNYMRDTVTTSYSLEKLGNRNIVIATYRDGFSVTLGYLVKGSLTGSDPWLVIEALGSEASGPHSICR